MHLRGGCLRELIIVIENGVRIFDNRSLAWFHNPRALVHKKERQPGNRCAADGKSFCGDYPQQVAKWDPFSGIQDVYL
ncbi:hypothetical protein CEXT_568011 [Caerostris extrusa]|uniref:Uncharacterized protein n=1 Tax=Caerostris extrusa TaxID=172846 RepID=A0AAV4PW77_CAEEX|nr:hypothetical protein CEXT_568011 [Caerostris extrusa]